MLFLALSLSLGLTPEDKLRTLEARCSQGAATACFEAGLVYDKEGGDDKSKALTLYDKACGGRDLRGCNSMGVALRRGQSVERDLKRALALVRQACEGKLAVGCFNWAAMLAAGEGVSKDAPRAARLFEQACDAEYAPACSARGNLCFTPNVTKTKSAGNPLACARPYLERGCTLRDGEGCYNLGLVLQELKEANHYVYAAYEKACTFGVAAGCSWQGLMLQTGQGGALSTRGMTPKRAEQKGAHLMEKACKQGYPEGCFNAAMAYIKGRGVTKDHQRAGELLLKACSGGVNQACTILERQKKPKRR